LFGRHASRDARDGFAFQARQFDGDCLAHFFTGGLLVMAASRAANVGAVGLGASFALKVAAVLRLILLDMGSPRFNTAHHRDHV
jgi:hypothetical protein